MSQGLGSLVSANSWLPDRRCASRKIASVDSRLGRYCFGHRPRPKHHATNPLQSVPQPAGQSSRSPAGGLLPKAYLVRFLRADSARACTRSTAMGGGASGAAQPVDDGTASRAAPVAIPRSKVLRSIRSSTESSSVSVIDEYEHSPATLYAKQRRHPTDRTPPFLRMVSQQLEGDGAHVRDPAYHHRSRNSAEVHE